MSDETAAEAESGKAKKKGILPLLLGLFLAVLMGGGGFYAAYSGMLGGKGETGAEMAEKPVEHVPVNEAVVFVPIDPILVSLPNEAPARHLRFRAEIETIPAHEQEVARIMPRILDVMNSYLRAVSTEDLERPTALIRLRAQLLRRIQIVAGDHEIRDLLVTEFVLN